MNVGFHFSLPAYFAAAQEINATIVRDSEEPRPKRAAFVVRIELSIGIKKCFLNDVFAVHNGTGHAGAVAVEAWAQVGDGFEKSQVAGIKRTPGIRVDNIVHTLHYDSARLKDTKARLILGIGGDWTKEGIVAARATRPNWARADLVRQFGISNLGRLRFRLCVVAFDIGA
jgi:hypothetical protein